MFLQSEIEVKIQNSTKIGNRDKDRLYLYIEKYKTLLREIKKDLNKRRYTMFMYCKTQYF